MVRRSSSPPIGAYPEPPTGAGAARPGSPSSSWLLQRCNGSQVLDAGPKPSAGLKWGRGRCRLAMASLVRMRDEGLGGSRYKTRRYQRMPYKAQFRQFRHSSLARLIPQRKLCCCRRCTLSLARRIHATKLLSNTFATTARLQHIKTLKTANALALLFRRQHIRRDRTMALDQRSSSSSCPLPATFESSALPNFYKDRS
ncbi:hypothetical protein SCHPADRAFT_52459 [Schizopora paradoxa]|uniref:Uncharacterized protein n=1 Tax=Schizopora paradoxa TaxID=27342 RepID=A0A0H2SD16_9AGAM|nr:hypothetical protein SCHPADRAFT_52459 [Schizopora paradoxa]